jgi:hypothetical protein
MRTSLISLAVLAATVSASYLLEDDYASDAFADMFDFFTVRMASSAVELVHTNPV